MIIGGKIRSTTIKSENTKLYRTVTDIKINEVLNQTEKS